MSRFGDFEHVISSIYLLEILSLWCMYIQYNHNYFIPDDFAFDHTGCAEENAKCPGTWADSVERMVVVCWFGDRELRKAQQVSSENIHWYVFIYIYTHSMNLTVTINWYQSIFFLHSQSSGRINHMKLTTTSLDWWRWVGASMPKWLKLWG